MSDQDTTLKAIGGFVSAFMGSTQSLRDREQDREIAATRDSLQELQGRVVGRDWAQGHDLGALRRLVR